MSMEPDPYISMTLAGEDVDTAAWFLLNKQEFADLSAPQATNNVPLSGTDGVLGRRTYDDEATVDGQWVITGNVAPDGTPYDNPAAGLATNKRLFRERYFRAPRDSFGCVESSIVDVDGTMLQADVQPGPPRHSEGEFECATVMSVVIPRGEYVEGGS